MKHLLEVDACVCMFVMPVIDFCIRLRIRSNAQQVCKSICKLKHTAAPQYAKHTQVNMQIYAAAGNQNTHNEVSLQNEVFGEAVSAP